MGKGPKAWSMKKGKDFWGPPTWVTFHSFAATFKPGKERAFKLFLEVVLPELMPCENCAANLLEKIQRFPPDPYLTNNDNAFFYSYLIHDLANQHITRYHPDKPKVSPPYDDVKSRYFRALGQECKDCKV